MLQPLKRVLCLLMAAALLLPCAIFAEEAPNPTRNPNAAEYDAEKPEDLDENQLTAWSALVMEESTGDIIFEKDIDMILYPASTTKIMTVLLGIECCDLDEIVTASWNAVNIGDPDATMLGLDEGEEMRMEDLLYGTLMRSGNDGAIAIAEHVSGSVEEFVRLMNETAYNLGMTNTHFMNPHGLHDPNHYSTARDLATLARYAMSNETFRQIAKTKSYNIDETNTHRARTLTTRHRIMLSLHNGKENSYYYAPMTGIKSGYHSMAQYCYVGAASKEGVDLISVVLCSGMYDYMRDTKRLMEYGFSQYESVTLGTLYQKYPFTFYTSGFALDDHDLGELKLSAVPADPANDPLITLRKDDVDVTAENLHKMVLVQYSRSPVAPIEAGEIIGTMTYVVPGTGQLVEYNLLATRSVPKRTDLPMTLEEIAAMSAADPNPLPPITPEIIFLFALPFLITGGVILVIWYLIRMNRKFYARLPKNSNRYAK